MVFVFYHCFINNLRSHKNEYIQRCCMCNKNRDFRIDSILASNKKKNFVICIINVEESKFK